ncbi:MAG: hypothetical protein HQL05_13495 [Nitrospirae bacterium]|uniref:adenylate/guanylate cyclase domain-containing protein n=1 Tax=Candidatus Magnetobacterium casense TaxID=1455061 RepID=UPI00058C0FA1|nr:adenylate/guanylate cyclase domain-containing protein [Candidatus Magnetobacterium casensis]MBF0338829.1 hypothetical protein [Nitrospirota bacterium]
MKIPISPVVEYVWQIAADEAYTTRHRYIEKRHILIGVCKIGDILTLYGLNADLSDLDTIKAEIKALDELFLGIRLDRKDLKRIVREIIGAGEHNHTENGVHRSKECKEAFNRADLIAQSVKSEAITTFHLLAAIMEEPGEHVEKAINEAGITIEAMREALNGSLNRPLTTEDIKKIAMEALKEVWMELRVKDVFFDASEEVLGLLCGENCKLVNGERLIKLAIERFINIPLKEKMLKGELTKGCIVEAGLANGNIVFEITDIKKDLEAKLKWASSYQEGMIEDEPPVPNSSEVRREFKVIMFTDLMDSVTYYDNHGTIEALNWIRSHEKIIIPIIQSHNGMVLKKIGDGIMASFKTAADSVRASIDIQRSIAQNNQSTEERRRGYVRIGMNAGDVLHAHGDVYGNVVNIASRVQNLTPPGCIYISDVLYNLIKHNKEFNVTPLGPMDIKGMRSKLNVYKVEY